MHRTRKLLVLVAMLIPLIVSVVRAETDDNVIHLSWQTVADMSQDNIGLRLSQYDHRVQKLNVKKSVSAFLPQVNYQFSKNDNRELQTIAFGGQTFKMGTKYNNSHSISVSLPIFTGRSRWASYRIAHHTERAMNDQLRGKTDETVLQTLGAYFGIMMADALVDVNNEAVQASKANLEKTEQFAEVNAASKLDLQRALAQYSSSLPKLADAKQKSVTARHQMKFLLDLGREKQIAVDDTLQALDFVGEYRDYDLDELITLAMKERPELSAMNHQVKAAKNGQVVAASTFLPTTSIFSNWQHTAMSDESSISREDYGRSHIVGLQVTVPILTGGQRLFGYQQAVVQTRKAKLSKHQVEESIVLDVEQNFFAYKVARENLDGLRETLEQARETYRLAKLMYDEGMSTQVEMLDSQLFYISSYTGYKQGVFEYNMSQLQLLKAVGKLQTILG